MKKFGGMMYPKQKQTKTEALQCCKCKKQLTPSTAYYYVDSCNCAITSNAPPHCKECYVDAYGRW